MNRPFLTTRRLGIFAAAAALAGGAVGFFPMSKSDFQDLKFDDGSSLRSSITSDFFACRQDIVKRDQRGEDVAEQSITIKRDPRIIIEWDNWAFRIDHVNRAIINTKLSVPSINDQGSPTTKMVSDNAVVSMNNVLTHNGRIELDPIVRAETALEIAKATLSCLQLESTGHAFQELQPVNRETRVRTLEF